MSELTSSDVADFTDGRIPDDDITATLLAGTLAGLRRYCGWHVTPVLTGQVVTLNRPDCGTLTLPTLQLVELTALTDHGADILDDAVWTPTIDGQPRRAQVGRKVGLWMSGNGQGSVSATMTHGFTEDDAADWRLAVLQAVNRVAGGDRDDPALVRKKVAEVEYFWAAPSGEWGGVSDEYGLDRFRLTPEI